MSRGLAAWAAALVALVSIAGCGASDSSEARRRPASSLPNLSGLAWISGDTLLAVHDAKNPEENGDPRVSLVWLPESPAGVLWQPLEVEWPPPQGFSHDLESVAVILGTRSVLLMESGDDEGVYRRIFLAELSGQRLRILESTEWPIRVENVEGSTVARLGDRLVFLYAERAQGSTSTAIRWANLQLQPLRFGAFREVTFSIPADMGLNRPVSAMEVDPAGHVYVASAFDPDVDTGPFQSAVWRIGRITSDLAGEPQVILDAAPDLLGTANGVKIESIAVREQANGDVLLIIGTDDEDYGAILRSLVPKPE